MNDNAPRREPRLVNLNMVGVVPEYPDIEFYVPGWNGGSSDGYELYAAADSRQTLEALMNKPSWQDVNYKILCSKNSPLIGAQRKKYELWIRQTFH
jgi:hypothetical protein